MEDSLDDYNLLAKWLSNPVVLEYYEGRNNSFNLDKVIRKFGPRARGEDQVTSCIVGFKGYAVGYIQYYKIDFDDYDLRRKIDTSKYIAPYGMDLFIGDTAYWNMGIGTKLVRLVIEYLFNNENVDAIFIDPQTWNKRAIRCYEKSGFSPVAVVEKRELHEGEFKDNLIMVISKNSNTE